MILSEEKKSILNIERAVNELKSGYPVIVNSSQEKLIVISPETAQADILQKLYDSSYKKLIITGNRLSFIVDESSLSGCYSINLDEIDSSNIAYYAGLNLKDDVALDSYQQATDIESKALNLAKIAELIPSVIVFKNENIDVQDFFNINIEEIENHANNITDSLVEASRANLVIKHSINAEIICYRAGSKEHYAIIVGKLSDSPVVRIHSSCYTGDLLNSLQCDCHDQLHTAIEKMNQEGSGIVLYMMQEGRGIGLVNKIRSYEMKQTGLDTVDANRILGFDDDARLFDPAVKILNLLGVEKLKLLTNNPRKAKALQEKNIDVVECVAHIIESNTHNEKYLKTKFDKLGHVSGA